MQVLGHVRCLRCTYCGWLGKVLSHGLPCLCFGYTSVPGTTAWWCNGDQLRADMPCQNRKGAAAARRAGGFYISVLGVLNLPNMYLWQDGFCVLSSVRKCYGYSKMSMWSKSHLACKKTAVGGTLENTANTPTMTSFVFYSCIRQHISFHCSVAPSGAVRPPLHRPSVLSLTYI